MRGKQRTVLALIALIAVGTYALSDGGGGTPPAASPAAGPTCSGPGDGDATEDGFIGLDDLGDWGSCHTGPIPAPLPAVCCALDLEGNATVDLADFAGVQNRFGVCTSEVALNRCSDDCGDSRTIAGEGPFEFNNRSATLDGPGHTGCVFFAEDQLDRDVWGCWTSPCTDRVFVAACGSTDADTRIAVYDGCACPVSDARLLTCNDDACDLQSLVAFDATVGQSYLIRLGVFPGVAGGAGSFQISCGLPTCPGSGGCFADHASPGCDDEVCCETVCTTDPICCELEWDQRCVDEAHGHCGDGFTACGPGAGSCIDPEGNGTPGCDDVECCNAVCRADSYCCGAGGVGEWDALCADAEAAICRTSCGSRSGSCFNNLCIGGENPGAICESSDQCLGGVCGGNGTPGCELDSCCAEVCPRDTFCCQVEWDGSCVDRARELCISVP